MVEGVKEGGEEEGGVGRAEWIFLYEAHIQHVCA